MNLTALFTTPSLLIGLFTAIGLLAQKESFEKVCKATVNAAIGFLLLEAGSLYLQNGPLQVFDRVFHFAFHVQSVIPHNEAVIAESLNQTVVNTSLILILGMICNLILARFTCFKFIFLSGHHAFYMACLIGVALETAGLDLIQVIIAGSLLTGLSMSFFPAIAQRPVKRITKADKIALGHFSTVSYVLSWKIGAAIKKHAKDPLRIQSTEKIRFPKKLSFLRDTNVLITLFMTGLFFVASLVALRMPDHQQIGVTNENWFIFSLLNGLKFTCGIVMILTGVRMTVGEIVPAFKGIAKKLVPDSKPAIDCPILFTYAPNAVMIGFLCSFFGAFLFMLVSLWIRNELRVDLPVILPGVVAHFFCGATAGIFGNVEGGWKGCVLGSFIAGFLLSALSLGAYLALNSLQIATTVSDADFAIVVILSVLAGRIFSPVVLFGAIVGLFLVPFAISGIQERKKTS
ncbi:PTS ascorbate transporter subunit IIC [uncultured Dubosiella sp.]|uniref:PTS ascorbate transporter subunit IIC n=1 Tax=uncultured Dubosiella sp. TaxID=1937011 RepID=UPI00272F11E4|nr:PTS ascorbate transporter subunit IIC [uncultured Dubosiella sp.]